MGEKLNKTEEQTRLEKVASLRWDKWGNSVIGAITAILAAAHNKDYTYEYLMGISGCAFRLQVHSGTLCASSPHADCGYSCTNDIFELLPFSIHEYKLAKKSEAYCETARQAVVASINQGYAVLADAEESGLVIGYTNDHKLIFRSFWDSNDTVSDYHTWPWGFRIISPLNKVIDYKELRRHALKKISTLARAELVNDYYCGLAAYDKWVDLLLDVSENAEEAVMHNMLLSNAWIYNSLVDARQAGQKFLHEILPLCQAANQELLGKCIENYQKMSELLTENRSCVVYPWEMEGISWGIDTRLQQIEVIKKCKFYEQEIVKYIDQLDYANI